MRIQQTIEHTAGSAHLVITLTKQPSGKVLARRVWEDAGKYVVSADDGMLTLRVPRECELDIKPNVQGSA